ncbi:MAG: hypothetical protein LC777_09400, partial [Actinobacteria bacterium]|nr:hypothetical protein [Actinomycetota bacterium]
MFCAEAAVGLLIGHRRWLLRGDFVGEFTESFESAESGSAMTFVDWPAAVAALDSGRLPCSSSEGQVLRLAASIAEGIPVDLRQAVCGLDATNAVLAARALLDAAGHGRA